MSTGLVYVIVNRVVVCQQSHGMSIESPVTVCERSYFMSMGLVNVNRGTVRQQSHDPSTDKVTICQRSYCMPTESTMSADIPVPTGLPMSKVTYFNIVTHTCQQSHGTSRVAVRQQSHGMSTGQSRIVGHTHLLLPLNN